TEAVEGHRHRNRHVHADHSDLHVMRERACRVAVAREDGSAVAELVLVDQAKRALQIGRANYDQHRAEDFLAIDPHLRLDAIEQAGAEIEAVGMTVYLQRATIDDQRRTFLDSDVDVVANALQMLTRDERPHLDAVRRTRAHLERRDERSKLSD